MALSPDAIENLYNQVIQLQDQAKYVASLPLLKKILHQVPHHFPAWHSLGQAHMKLGRSKESIICLRESLKYCPEYFPAKLMLASVLYRHEDQIMEAQEILKDVIAHNPDVPDPHFLLSDLHLTQNNFSEAQRFLKKYLTLQRQANDNNTDFKKDPEKLVEHELKVLLHINPFLQSIDEEKTQLKDLSAGIQTALKTIQPSNSTPTGITPSVFYLSYYDTNPKTQLEDLSKVYRHAFPCLSWTSPHCLNQRRLTRQKIKIGIASSYLDKFHAVGFCYAPLVKALSRDDYELIYFRLPEVGHKPTPVYPLKERLGKLRCIDLPDDTAKAQRIVAEENLDILWYTDIGMNHPSYFLAHSRLAPVQCVSGGHPTTTGISTIDYYISSELLEPEQAQENYTEKLIQLPTFAVVYEDSMDFPTGLHRSDFGLPETGAIYLCPQTLFKIHPKMDPLFKGILEADPMGTLVFSYAGTPFEQPLRERLQKSLGAAYKRCTFIPTVSQERFYALLQCADAVLDSCPLGGGNTTLQALIAGVPLVTLKARDMRSAVATSLYRLMGIEDCIADSAEEYVQTSLKVAADKRLREDLSQKILENKHLIFDQSDEIIAAYNDLFKSISGRV